MDKINIVLSSDNNYAQHVAVVIASVMNNTKKNKQIRFFLLADNIDIGKKALLKQTADSFNAELNIIDLQENSCFDNLYTSGHISKAAYFRIILADLMPADVHKVIYVDVDLIVLDDIEFLWNINLQGKPLGAVADYGILSSARLIRQKNKAIGLSLDGNYFNSGVLIIDVDLWRQYNYSSKVIKLASSVHLPHHDQDALNKVFMNNWTKVPLRWNVIPPVYNLFLKILLNKKFRKNAVSAKKNMAIMHYAGRYKPWEFSVHKGFNDKYYKFLQLTAFKNEKMPQPNQNMKGKSIFRQLLRLKMADFWCKVF